LTHKVLIDYNRRGWAEEKESVIRKDYPEILQKLGHLDSVTKGTLTSLRKIRNGIVHEKKKASKDDALNCMHVVNEMIYKVFNNDPNPFSGIMLIR